MRIGRKIMMIKAWRKVNKGMHHFLANRAPRNRHADKTISMIYTYPSFTHFGAIVVDRVLRK